MTDAFGIVTFDNEGPITTWQRLASVQAHNNRDQPEPHCDPNGLKPAHFIGRGNLVEEVKAKLREHGIDPASLRKNANIAFEAVLSASRSFFEGATEDERWDRIAGFVLAARKAAEATWGRFRIVSLVLHLDEYTPHIHVVILPLIKKVYERWPERGEVWALVGRVISGPGEYQRVHDIYAEHMAALGLKRGESGSRAKYRPYSEEIAELEAEKARAVEAAAASQKATEVTEAERLRMVAEWRARFDRQEQIKAELDGKAADLAKRETALRRDLLRQAARARRVERDAEALVGKLEKADRIGEAAAEELRVLKQTAAALDTTIDHALAFRRALLTLPLGDLPTAAVEVLRGIRDFERATELVGLPAGGAEALPVELCQRFKDGIVARE